MSYLTSNTVANASVMLFRSLRPNDPISFNALDLSMARTCSTRALDSGLTDGVAIRTGQLNGLDVVVSGTMTMVLLTLLTNVDDTTTQGLTLACSAPTTGSKAHQYISPRLNRALMLGVRLRVIGPVLLQTLAQIQPHQILHHHLRSALHLPTPSLRLQTRDWRPRRHLMLRKQRLFGHHSRPVGALNRVVVSRPRTDCVRDWVPRVIARPLNRREGATAWIASPQKVRAWDRC